MFRESTDAELVMPGRFRFRLRTLLKIFVIVAVILALVTQVVPFLFYQWQIAGYAASPPELNTLLASLPASRDFPTKVYCIDDFIDREYIWRVEISRPAYQALGKEFGMSSVAIPMPDSGFWKYPPNWWDPNPNAAGEFGVWHDPRLGVEMLTFYDEKRELLYGWSYFQF
jgi:hypothetical protein